jgi:hypothetical protein
MSCAFVTATALRVGLDHKFANASASISRNGREFLVATGDAVTPIRELMIKAGRTIL